MRGQALVLGCASMALASCAERTTYDTRRVEMLGTGVTDRGIEIVLRVPGEESHRCAGADFKVSGREIHFRLARARVGEDPEVDVKARRREDGSYLLAFPWDWRRSKTVELVDEAGRKYGSWTMKDESAGSAKQGP